METTFQNTTIFLAPVWFDDYARFTKELHKDPRYIRVVREQRPQYLLPYAARIVTDTRLCSAFELDAAYFPALCMYDSYRSSSGKATLSRVRMTCFATGCGFMEFHIVYDGLSIDEIGDFTFHFKKAAKPDGALTMYEAMQKLLPSVSQLKLFFTDADYKRECRVFHQLLIAPVPQEEEIRKMLVRLRRGYHKDFPTPLDDSAYDMLYEPYPYDHWAGSQEGLVSVSHESGIQSADSYLHKHKQSQLMQNYHFMYLLLLNQRFSAICYIQMIAEREHPSRRERQELSRRIAQLKTVFAFNVISDDQLYQNIYSRMYAILDIDRLLDDIHDNEVEADLLYKAESAEAEDMTSKFLLGLSILSLFSVLIDAASYFDRWSFISDNSTLLSLVSTVAIVVLLIVWLLACRFRR